MTEDPQGPGEEARSPADHLRELSEAAREAAETLAADVETYAGWAVEALRAGGKLIYCGNGGSASTAEHMAAEYVVRFRRRRPSLPAVALTANSAVVTAAANDFAYEEVFAHALEGLGGPDDLLVLHSTSGDSPNVVRAAEAAREMGIRTVGLLGGDGGEAAPLVDLALTVPTSETARAQELHLAVEHAVADRVDAVFAGP